jgi:transposase-like protein
MTSKQRRAARHLARGATQATAAQRVGVAPRTIRYWLTDVPGFRELSQDPAEAARDPEVVEVFSDLLSHNDPAVQLAAVKIGLQFPDALRQARERDTAAREVVIRDLRTPAIPEPTIPDGHSDVSEPAPAAPVADEPAF